LLSFKHFAPVPSGQSWRYWPFTQQRWGVTPDVRYGLIRRMPRSAHSLCAVISDRSLNGRQPVTNHEGQVASGRRSYWLVKLPPAAREKLVENGSSGQPAIRIIVRRAS